MSPFKLPTLPLPLHHSLLLTVAYRFYHRIGHHKRVLSLWDTIGDEAYDRLRPLSYPNADVFLICFAVSEPSSFESVKTKWYHELTSWSNVVDSVWVLLGLHADRSKSEHKSSKELYVKQDAVSREEAEQLAKNLGSWSKKNVPYLECDARDKSGLQAVVEAVLYPLVAIFRPIRIARLLTVSSDCYCGFKNPLCQTEP